ncbi:MAG: hypothetical protein C4K47_06680 [Candidatus Thorarchaeota archaeon]|nr:MAG: hypothetical protein C4K47_06680 [Candidatus Thorarchaeota archaeon]
MQGVARGKVYPTEDQERVEQAIKTVLSGGECTVVDHEAYAELEIAFNEAKSLEWLRQRIQDLRIIDAARTRLQSNWDGVRTRLCIDKQAAFLGRVRIIDDSEESPSLGYIEIMLQFDGLREFNRFVTWMTPRTENGRIVTDRR